MAVGSPVHKYFYPASLVSGGPGLVATTEELNYFTSSLTYNLPLPPVLPPAVLQRWDPVAMTSSKKSWLSRREALKRSGWGAAALLLAPSGLAGCAEPADVRSGEREEEAPLLGEAAQLLSVADWSSPRLVNPIGAQVAKLPQLGSIGYDEDLPRGRLAPIGYDLSLRGARHVWRCALRRDRPR